MSMKLPYAALLALAVWYLIAPPKVLYYGATTWDMNAPLSKWVVMKPFDSPEDCAKWKSYADYRANQIRPTFDVDRCIASDDPRLSN